MQYSNVEDTGIRHEHFITVVGMTPDEYKNGGENLILNYSYASTPFGEIIIASTPIGICSMEFADNYAEAFNSLQRKFPKARYCQKSDTTQQNALLIFTQDRRRMNTIRLHLKGTDFQLKVWEALLKIPMGEMTTYGEIAEQIDNPKAWRAVGTAVGKNPVAFLIPCHRVIRTSGDIGNYHWGKTRKNAIIGWEAATIRHSCHTRPQ